MLILVVCAISGCDKPIPPAGPKPPPVTIAPPGTAMLPTGSPSTYPNASTPTATAEPHKQLIARLTELKGKTNRPPTAVPSVPLLGNQPYLLDSAGQLTAIDLPYTPATDADLEMFKGLDAVNSINLTGTQITDAGLEHLSDLKTLTSLLIWDTRVSEEAAAKFRESHPTCKVRGPDHSKEN
ncbi:MAG: hypothetical protein AABP62_28015 [Planctomycetota bacterium]